MVTVTYGGEPVTVGHVDLNNEQTGEGGGGELNAQGIATITDVPLGDYTVTVLPPPPDPAPVEEGQPAATMKEYPQIPEQFRRIATSPLRAAVQNGSNQFKFDLQAGE